MYTEHINFKSYRKLSDLPDIAYMLCLHVQNSTDHQLWTFISNLALSDNLPLQLHAVHAITISLFLLDCASGLISSLSDHLPLKVSICA